MADQICYICLSDLHLGEEDSLLTNLRNGSSDPDPGSASPVMKRFVNCLEDLLERANEGSRPVLVLCGDVLELALANTNEAAMCFERFIGLLMKPGSELVEDIIYIPGNHDHHLWESARETQYVEYIETIKPGMPYNPPYHATSMFADEISNRPASYFLSRLSRKQPHLGMRDFTVRVAYPNLAITGSSGDRCVILHHGHYIDIIYTLMSIIKTNLFPERALPRYTWDMEAENFAWIDFFWSTLGRSGELGKDVERIYEKMHDRKEFKSFLSGVVKRLKDNYDLPGWDCLTAWGLKKGLHMAADRVMDKERDLREGALSSKGEKGLKEYMNGPLTEQIRTECGDNNRATPSDYALVFGHTHKPFERIMDIENLGSSMEVYNTGGWVVDTVRPEPLHGASMILLDEQLNATAVNLYRQERNPEDYRVRVTRAVEEGGHQNSFHRKIQGLIDPSAEPWRALSRTIAGEVEARMKMFRDRISMS